MDKQIQKTTSVNLKINYSEACNLMKGCTIHTNIKIFEITESYDIEEDNKYNDVQISIKIDEESLKHLEFMRVYLQNKEKNEMIKSSMA